MKKGTGILKEFKKIINEEVTIRRKDKFSKIQKKYQDRFKKIKTYAKKGEFKEKETNKIIGMIKERTEYIKEEFLKLRKDGFSITKFYATIFEVSVMIRTLRLIEEKFRKKTKNKENPIEQTQEIYNALQNILFQYTFKFLNNKFHLLEDSIKKNNEKKVEGTVQKIHSIYFKINQFYWNVFKKIILGAKSKRHVPSKMFPFEELSENARKDLDSSIELCKQFSALLGQERMYIFLSEIKKDYGPDNKEVLTKNMFYYTIYKRIKSKDSSTLGIQGLVAFSVNGNKVSQDLCLLEKDLNDNLVFKNKKKKGQLNPKKIGHKIISKKRRSSVQIDPIVAKIDVTMQIIDKCMNTEHYQKSIAILNQWTKWLEKHPCLPSLLAIHKINKLKLSFEERINKSLKVKKRHVKKVLAKKTLTNSDDIVMVDVNKFFQVIQASTGHKNIEQLKKMLGLSSTSFDSECWINAYKQVGEYINTLESKDKHTFNKIENILKVLVLPDMEIYLTPDFCNAYIDFYNIITNRLKTFYQENVFKWLTLYDRFQFEMEETVQYYVQNIQPITRMVNYHLLNGSILTQISGDKRKKDVLENGQFFLEAYVYDLVFKFMCLPNECWQTINFQQEKESWAYFANSIFDLVADWFDSRHEKVSILDNLFNRCSRFWDQYINSIRFNEYCVIANCKKKAVWHYKRCSSNRDVQSNEKDFGLVTLRGADSLLKILNNNMAEQPLDKHLQNLFVVFEQYEIQHEGGRLKKTDKLGDLLYKMYYQLSNVSSYLHGLGFQYHYFSYALKKKLNDMVLSCKTRYFQSFGHDIAYHNQPSMNYQSHRLKSPCSTSMPDIADSGYSPVIPNLRRRNTLSGTVENEIRSLQQTLNHLNLDEQYLNVHTYVQNMNHPNTPTGSNYERERPSGWVPNYQAMPSNYQPYLLNEEVSRSPRSSNHMAQGPYQGVEPENGYSPVNPQKNYGRQRAYSQIHQY